MIVLDASAAVRMLDDAHEPGESLRRILEQEKVWAPELLDLEVCSALRRQVSSGDLPAEEADRSVRRLRSLRVQRVSHTLLLTRCWELRHSLSVYDASYVAIAEAVDAPLVTADARLARAPGPVCRFVLV